LPVHLVVGLLPVPRPFPEKQQGLVVDVGLPLFDVLPRLGECVRPDVLYYVRCLALDRRIPR